MREMTQKALRGSEYGYQSPEPGAGSFGLQGAVHGDCQGGLLQCRIIAMDEPSSSLTGHEVEHLFGIIRDLKSRGISIIYISHKMEEILEIADDVTIMRDGKKVGTWPGGRAYHGSHHLPDGGSGDDPPLSPPKKRSRRGGGFGGSGYTSPFPKSLSGCLLYPAPGGDPRVGGACGSSANRIMEALFGLRSLASGGGAPSRQ